MKMLYVKSWRCGHGGCGCNQWSSPAFHRFDEFTWSVFQIHGGVWTANASILLACAKCGSKMAVAMPGNVYYDSEAAAREDLDCDFALHVAGDGPTVTAGPEAAVKQISEFAPRRYDSFTRKGYGRIYALRLSDVDKIHAIINLIDPGEFESYMPKDLVAPYTEFPKTVYLGKFDSISRAEIMAQCWAADAPCWCFDNGTCED